MNLIDKARQGLIDPLIGRDDEILRTLQILGRRCKNNPIFVGDPGVGKTAIAEGLALQILTGRSRPPFSMSKFSLSIWGRFWPGPSSGATSKRGSRA